MPSTCCREWATVRSDHRSSSGSALGTNRLVSGFNFLANANFNCDTALDMAVGNAFSQHITMLIQQSPVEASARFPEYSDLPRDNDVLLRHRRLAQVDHPYSIGT